MGQQQTAVAGSAAVRRMILVLTVAALIVAIFVATAVPAFAFAKHVPGRGSSGGQDRAVDQCNSAVDKQDVSNQGHHNSNDPGNVAPANCDHFFQQ